MITLAEFKSYMGIADTSQDTFAQTCVDEAIARVNTKGNRDFRAATYTKADFEGNDSKILLLPQFPISSITTLQYYDVDNATWVDLISEDGDTIANSVFISTAGKIELLKGYVFTKGLKFKVVWVTIAITDIDVIEGATKKVAAVFYKQSFAGKGSGRIGVNSENVNVGESNISTSFDMEKAIDDALKVVEPHAIMTV